MARIYLLDDHPVVRAGLHALLQDAGHTVLGEAEDVTQALADLKRLEPDVLVLDMHLDGRSGLEVLAELQRRQVATKVVVLSMSDHRYDVTEALRRGASAYVLKAAPGRELLAAIDDVVHGRRHLDAHLTDIALQGLTGDPERDAPLSPRERQILAMVASGWSSAAIGKELHLSPKTVDTYRSRLMARLELSDLPALVRWAVREKLIEL
jgi:DNA-binding NarL/FixJ family response regulator